MRKEVYELRRANEILKAASLFFATELDPDRPSEPLSSTSTASLRGRADLPDPGRVGVRLLPAQQRPAL